MSRLRLVFLMIILFLVSVSLVAGETPWRLAPLNPRFLAQQKGAALRSAPAVDGVPELSRPKLSPLDLSYLVETESPAVFPSSYDLRELGRIPLIKDQDGYPACQAFATMGMLESMLLPGEALDFSEWHIYRYHGFNIDNEYGSDSGGNWQMNAAYLLRWSGPVGEDDSPYGSGIDPDALSLPRLKHVQKMRFFPARSDGLDNAAIKRYLMEQGPLYASILYDSSSYNSASASHYFNGGVDANHGVVVVGWDDDFDRRRFRQLPPGNGAFILRNSWGSGWGDGGYFYMSYYDTGFQARMGALELADTDNYGLIYQHDPLGVISILGGVSHHAWAANVFAAREAGELAAVGFYLMAANSAYTIRVYRGLSGQTPSSGQLYTEQEGSWIHAGYITVPLDTPVPLAEGERFAVAVHFQTPGNDYPIPVEYPVNGYSPGASASPGESFVSHDGENWHDLTEVHPDTNACIKAYSRFSSPLRATVSAELRHSSGWILSYPYVRVVVDVDSGGADVGSVGIYRRSSVGGMYKVQDVSIVDLRIGQVEWFDTRVSADRTYEYQVRCFGPDGRFWGRSEWAMVEVVE